MKILGYGEDALTFWAISQRLGELLAAFEDPTPADAALVFYRPSFGRSASGDRSKFRRAEFGEFDAIIGTPRAVYLIESKWDGSSELECDTLSLRHPQERRHAVMRTYLTLWREQNPDNWTTFTEIAAKLFESEHPSVKFAPIRSKLARNLHFVLTSLSGMGKSIQDIALFMRQGNSSPGPRVLNDGFRCVTLNYDGVSAGSSFS